MAMRFARQPIGDRRAEIRGRVFINKNRCKGCELCIEFCPKDVLARSEDLNPKGYHYPVIAKDECVNCRLCVTVCPEYAIFSIPASAVATTDTSGSAPSGTASDGAGSSADGVGSSSSHPAPASATSGGHA